MDVGGGALFLVGNMVGQLAGRLLVHRPPAGHRLDIGGERRQQALAFTWADSEVSLGIRTARARPKSTGVADKSTRFQTPTLALAPDTTTGWSGILVVCCDP